MRWDAGEITMPIAAPSMPLVDYPAWATSMVSPVSKPACCGVQRCSRGGVTEKLLTFALGRGVDYFDAPAIRQILRDAEADDYRFASLILGIVHSVPFQMRTST